MKLILSSILIIALNSCASKLAVMSAPRALNERFYRLSKKKGVIYHKRCESLKEPFNCVDTEFPVDDLWGPLAGDHIVIPYKYVFPH